MFAPWLQAPITSSFTCKILSHNKSIIFPIRNSTQVGHSVHKLLALIKTHHRHQQVDQPRNSCVANHSSVTSWTALQTFVTIVPISRLLSATNSARIDRRPVTFNFNVWSWWRRNLAATGDRDLFVVQNHSWAICHDHRLIDFVPFATCAALEFKIQGCDRSN